MPATTPFHSVRHRLQVGDILEYRPENCVGQLIAGDDVGGYSHTSMVVESMGRLCVVQAQQWRNTAITWLEDEVACCPGRIDVWRAHTTVQVRRRAAELAVEQTGSDRKYPFHSLVRATIVRMPLARLIVGRFRDLKLDPFQLPAAKEPKFCIELVDWCYRVAAAEIFPGRFQPFQLIRAKHVRDTAPNDLVQAGTATKILEGLVL